MDKKVLLFPLLVYWANTPDKDKFQYGVIGYGQKPIAALINY